MKPLLRYLAPPVEGDQSQFGEGRIISECLRRLGIDSGLCVEFGAGDGLHLANTAHLWQNGWDAALIELNMDLAGRLVANTDPFYPKVAACRGVVTPENVNEWVKPEADVVSIDVDGDDYAILCAMNARPAVLCVEHHPMIPIHVAMDGGPDVGCSAAALVEWAEGHGYLPVAMTHCNSIMVTDAHRGLFTDVEIDPHMMFDPSGVTWVLSNVRTGDYEIHGPWPFGRGAEIAPGGALDG